MMGLAARGAGGLRVHLVPPTRGLDEPACAVAHLGLAGALAGADGVNGVNGVAAAGPGTDVVVVVGGERDAVVRVRRGVVSDAPRARAEFLRIVPPLGMPSLGARALRARLMDMGVVPTAVIAWGASLEVMARRACPGVPCLVLDFSRGLAELIEVRGAASRGGARGGATAVLSAPLPDRVPVAPSAPEARARMRARLGVGEGVVALALAGATLNERDAPAFIHILGMLHYAGMSVAGVVERGATARLRAARRRRREGMATLPLIEVDAPIMAWAGACDCAILAPGDRFERAHRAQTHGSTLLAHALAASGVRVITARAATNGAGALAASAAPHADIVLAPDPQPASLARTLRAAITEPAPAGADDATRQAHALAWRRILDLAPTGAGALAALEFAR
jgi:hypothetical protein